MRYIVCFLIVCALIVMLSDARTRQAPAGSGDYCSYSTGNATC
jgi:hypothetical protein